MPAPAGVIRRPDWDQLGRRDLPYRSGESTPSPLGTHAGRFSNGRCALAASRRGPDVTPPADVAREGFQRGDRTRCPAPRSSPTRCAAGKSARRFRAAAFRFRRRAGTEDICSDRGRHFWRRCSSPRPFRAPRHGDQRGLNTYAAIPAVPCRARRGTSSSCIRGSGSGVRGPKFVSDRRRPCPAAWHLLSRSYRSSSGSR